MHVRPLFPSLLAGALCSAAPAFAAGDAGCGDSPAPTPHLSIRYGGSSAGGLARLHLERGPAGGHAWIFVDLDAQRASRVDACGRTLRGELLERIPLDASGAFVRELPRAVQELAPRFQVWTLPARGSAAASALSNAVRWAPRDTPEASGRVADQIVITEFMKDPTAVSDTRGEWIELYNPSPLAIDIGDWVLSDLGSESTVLDRQGARVTIRRFSHFVIGRSADPAETGGVHVDFVYSGFSMSNGADEIVLSRPDGSVVDQVAYDDGVLWDDLPGRSLSLDPAAYDAAANDSPDNWCPSRRRLAPGSSDSGTPGELNDACR